MRLIRLTIAISILKVARRIALAICPVLGGEAGCSSIHSVTVSGSGLHFGRVSKLTAHMRPLLRGTIDEC